MAGIVAIVQARMSSLRLPGKSLALIAGRPLLWHVVTRVCQAKMLARVVVATTDGSSSDSIAHLCQIEGWQCYRGSENDVLGRVYEAAQEVRASVVVRICGDSPLVSGAEIDRVVRYHLGCANDYSANCFPPCLPDGLDTEVIAFKALERAHLLARIVSDREHVTPWLRRNLPGHHWSSIGHTPDLSQYRLCIDRPEDMTAMQAIMAIAGPECTWQQAVEVVRTHPELAALYQASERNASYNKQVREEQRA